MRLFLRKYFRGDGVIWTVMAFMAVISLLAVYSSTGTLAYMQRGGNTTFFLLKHAFFLGVGFAVAWITHNIHYKMFLYLTRILLPISIALLCITLFFGKDLNNASRWLEIPGLGIQFQPSELAKYVAVMFIAMKLAINQTEDRPPTKALISIALVLASICGLIITQNLSTAFLIGVVAVTMMFIGRVPMRYVAGLVVGTIAIFSVVVFVELSAPQLNVMPRVHTWIGRVKPVAEMLNIEVIENSNAGDDFQSNMSKVAVATGGIIGKGPGNSEQKHILPHPYSDFMYAIIIEEGGLFFGFLILMCYFIILFRTALMVKDCKSTFPAFLTIGLGMVVFLQAFIHMGVSVGLGPVTGQTLPFMSMGGTSLLFTGFAFGMIQSVSRFSNEPEEQIDVEV